MKACLKLMKDSYARANTENVDLIVMESRGLGGISGWVLGSTSRRVVETCEKPILIVK